MAKLLIRYFYYMILYFYHLGGRRIDQDHFHFTRAAAANYQSSELSERAHQEAPTVDQSMNRPK